MCSLQGQAEKGWRIGSYQGEQKPFCKLSPRAMLTLTVPLRGFEAPDSDYADGQRSEHRCWTLVVFSRPFKRRFSYHSERCAYQPE